MSPSDDPLPELDPDGFLRHSSDWTEAVARQLALKEHIQLTEKHLELVHLLRNWYREYGIHPTTRVFVKHMARQLGAEKGNSIYFMQCFPGTPLKTLSRLAGLPKPPNCD